LAVSVIQSWRGPEGITMPAPQSKTQQIIDAIVADIASGRLKPGDRIASAAELRERFGTSITPVREAVNNLKARGVLTGAPGIGVFVADHSSG
jgi:GntR family transcriptional regulator